MITFKTAQALYKYLQIETEWLIGDNEKTYKNNSYPFTKKKLLLFPAPNLEELLKVSPIALKISFDYHYDDYIYIHYYGFGKRFEYINKSDSLVEAVAKIIIQYYEEQEE